jgi:hypothetical protein
MAETFRAELRIPIEIEVPEGIDPYSWAIVLLEDTADSNFPNLLPSITGMVEEVEITIRPTPGTDASDYTIMPEEE